MTIVAKQHVFPAKSISGFYDESKSVEVNLIPQFMFYQGGNQVKEIKYVEVDELDFRLGLTDLLSVHGKLDKETNKLINTVIAETKRRAMRDALNAYIDKGTSMTHKELMDEEHKSARLGDFGCSRLCQA
jgi:hypothetical protein